jgi:transposase
MGPYSVDFRMSALAAYDRGEGSIREIAELFGIDKETIVEWLRLRRETGELEHRPMGGVRGWKLSPEDLPKLDELVQEKSDRSQAELARRLGQKHRIVVSRRTVGRGLRRLGLTRKKRTRRAREQTSPAVRGARGAFLRDARRSDRRRVLFYDEFGSHVGDTLPYAYAPSGARAICLTPGRPGTNFTLALTIGLRGVVAAFVFPGAMNGEAFEAYVQQILAPSLRPGDIVVVDRLSAHFNRAARGAIEARGATLRFLPPYSPDLNPVEECGSKVKHEVGRRQPDTVQALYDVIHDALHDISNQDLIGWYHHRAPYLFETSRTGAALPPL